MGNTIWANALKSTLKTAEVYRQLNGENGQSSNLGGQESALVLSGTISSTTGQAATPLAGDEKRTGPQHGAVAVVEMPKTADEAARLAERLVGDLLPPSLQVWLRGMEYWELVAPSVGGQAPKAPEKTPELVSEVMAAVKSLGEIMRPARERGPELEAEILKMFAAFNVYSGDQGKLSAMTQVWADELEEFPMFAIRKAYKYSVRTGEKLPSLAAFIQEVRHAMGSHVAQRRKLLVKWLGQ